MATSTIKKTCGKCGRYRSVTYFYKSRSGEYADMCRDCLTMYVDNADPKTFKWILEDLDFPYVEKDWLQTCNREYLKNPGHFNPRSVLGPYLRQMRLVYKGKGWADSDELNAINKAKEDATKQVQDDIDEEYEKDLLEKLESGEISEAQYDTLTKTKMDSAMKKLKTIPKFTKSATLAEIDEKTGEVTFSEKQRKKLAKEARHTALRQSIAEHGADDMEDLGDLLSSENSKKLAVETAESILPKDMGKEEALEVRKAEREVRKIQTKAAENEEKLDILPNQVQKTAIPQYTINEQEIVGELTPDDIKYLALKWGTSYKPAQWVRLEELYRKYESEYDLNIDRAEVLKSICKTKFKMDEALDIEDIKGYKDLSAVYDQLRKSGKFTESQNVEQQKREIDSIGELVSYVETKGGIIPRFDDPQQEPQDKIDFLINDIKNYINNLVRNELGLGSLIESYVEKLKSQEVKSAEELISEGFKLESNGDELTQEEAEEFQEFQMNEIEEESRRLVEAYGSL